MKTIEEGKEYSFKLAVKRSVFVATIYHVTTSEEVRQHLVTHRKKYPKARHNCYAYVIERPNFTSSYSSDDGEPAGTAGRPILGVLVKQELANVLVVVTRYFGGILLGTSGLISAYSAVTLELIQRIKLVDLRTYYTFRLYLPLNVAGKIIDLLVQKQVKIIEKKWDNTCELLVGLISQTHIDEIVKLASATAKIELRYEKGEKIIS